VDSISTYQEAELGSVDQFGQKAVHDTPSISFGYSEKTSRVASLLWVAGPKIRKVYLGRR